MGGGQLMRAEKFVDYHPELDNFKGLQSIGTTIWRSKFSYFLDDSGGVP